MSQDNAARPPWSIDAARPDKWTHTAPYFYANRRAGGGVLSRKRGAGRPQKRDRIGVMLAYAYKQMKQRTRP